MSDGWGMAGWGGTLSSGGGGGGGGPTVVNFSPPAGTPIQSATALQFDVMTPNSLVSLTISVVYRETGAFEVVYNREGFSVNYNSDGGFLGSERYAIAGGFHFILRRRAGWPLSPSVVVEGADNAGNPVPA